MQWWHSARFRGKRKRPWMGSMVAGQCGLPWRKEICRGWGWLCCQASDGAEEVISACQGGAERCHGSDLDTVEGWRLAEAVEWLLRMAEDEERVRV